MNAIQAVQRKLTSTGIFAAVLICALAGPAAAQNVLATISIPTASAGQVAVDPVLNHIYAGGGPAAGSSLTVIDGKALSVITTIGSSGGVSADMKQDNVWAGTGSGGKVNILNGSLSGIGSVTVGSCPAAVTFDCNKRRMWAASQCGSGSDPVWVFNADTLTEIGSAITPSGTISTPPVVNPDSGKLYVTSGGTSREVDPNTFAVTTTTFGTVMAVDSNTNKLFATSGSNLQIISGHSDAVLKTITLTYTPAAIGVNNAMAHVYLMNPAGNSIDVYSELGKKLSTFVLGSGNQPTTLAVDSVRGRVLVDVFNTGSSSWSLDVIEDLSTAAKCAFPGSCDY